MLAGIKEGGVFLLNTAVAPEKVFDSLTRDMQETIISKNIKVYAIDALKIALEVGSPKYISTIMQTCFFKLADIIPEAEAIGYIKKGIEKKFAKKGPRVRGFGGRVVSATGWIDTATTIGDMSNCCQHWGVLQRFGGTMPGKFEGTSGLTVGLEKKCDLSGVVCISHEKELKNDRPFYIEVSDDGQNWQRVRPNGVISGNQIRFDMKGSGAAGKFVRMLREGDKYEPGIAGFYVYGKPQR